jgi:hypothetical protein
LPEKELARRRSSKIPAVAAHDAAADVASTPHTSWENHARHPIRRRAKKNSVAIMKVKFSRLQGSIHETFFAGHGVDSGADERHPCG